MALEIISAENAMKRSRLNREKSYPSRVRDGHRLLPFAEVANRPRFSFDPTSKIFTAGSCFARNIERSLTRMGYNIVSSKPDFHNPFPDRAPFHRFNKYTIHSILNEVEWALGEKPMVAESLLCEAKGGLYCDLQTLGDSLCGPLDEMIKFRETYNQKFATIAQADVVMLTLGLVESWYDTHTDTYLNGFPGPSAIKANPGRFALHVLDYNEILEALNRIYAVVSKHNSSFRMLVTVSPVPLDRTFRTDDILVANCYSKSVQRAAIEAFVATHPVDYFPSYEAVTLTDQAYAWSDHDFRHVRGEMVDRLMGRVLESYTEVTEPQSVQKTSGYVKAYLAAGDLPKAKGAIEAHVDRFGLSFELVRLNADILFRMGDFDAAVESLRDFISKVNADPETAAEVLGQATSSVLKSATSLMNQCERLKGSDILSSSELDHMRAIDIVETALKDAPGNPDIGWLHDFVRRSPDDAAKKSANQSDKMMLIEAAAVARLRGLDGPDIASEAETIAAEAIAVLKVSEEIYWELASIYRRTDELEKSLETLDKIGRMGGGRAVAAVKHALPLARRLKRHDLVADLAEAVAKTL